MWLCLVIARYWKQIVDLLSVVLSLPIPLTPEICLLSILDEEQWSRYTRILHLPGAAICAQFHQDPYRAFADYTCLYIGCMYLLPLDACTYIKLVVLQY